MADKDALAGGPWRLFMHIVQICIWRMFNNRIVRGVDTGTCHGDTVWHFVLCVACF